MEQGLIESFLDKKNVFAVVGVSSSPQKFGHQVFVDLTRAGYTVFPINPGLDEVLGVKCYRSLDQLPRVPDVVDIVVPPSVTELVLEECLRLGIKKVWMQPGSESERAIAFCEENKIAALHGVCVMVERKKREMGREPTSG
ncbi:MAG: CoA-binding protein [Thermoplasmatota archaeon]